MSSRLAAAELGAARAHPDRDHFRTALTLAALAALSALDAIPAIVPLGDDVWILERPFRGFAAEHMEIWGPLGRILNIWTIDFIALSDNIGEGGLAAVIVAVRAVVVFGVYMGFRHGFGLRESTSLLGSAVFAFTPPAFEGWALLTTQGLALSAPLALYAAALFYRALDAPHGSRVLLGAAVVFLAALAFYELWILAVPAFVCVAAFVAWRRHTAPLSRALTVASAAGLVALAWLITLKVTGYLDAAMTTRAGAEGRAAEVADLVRGAALLRVGFVDHHLWRIVEIVRTGRLAMWDVTSVGVLAAAAVAGTAALVGWKVFREAARPTALASLPLALAAIRAAYLALIPPGLGNPGFPNTSRFYYAPGLFVALAVALAAETVIARGPGAVRRTVAIAAGAYVLWSGVLTRHYLTAAVTGARILRETAVAVASVPQAQRQGGVLVIAPAVVGTFATSAVEPWSTRPAVRRFGHVDPEGPLFLGECGRSVIGREQIPMHYRSPDAPMRWSAVVQHTGDQTLIGERAADVCDDRPM